MQILSEHTFETLLTNCYNKSKYHGKILLPDDNEVKYFTEELLSTIGYRSIPDIKGV